jgi:uncharacterized protein (TIGR02391 family)
MARRPRNPGTPAQQPTALTIPVADARQKIAERIQVGKELASKSLGYEALKEAGENWHKYNWDLLARIFTADEFAREVDFAGPPTVMSVSLGGPPPQPDIARRLRDRIAALESILECLPLLANPEFEAQAAGSPDPTSRALRAYRDLDLHPEISRAAGDLYLDGHYANAIEDSVKALNQLVRLRSGEELDGAKLMERVFAPGGPILRFNDLADDWDRDEQKGFMMMFSGAVAGLRNPRAHKLIKDDPERALEFIAFVSLLAKLLEGARKLPRSP